MLGRVCHRLVTLSIEEQMLEELKKIRELMTPKPESPQTPPKGLLGEFMDFLGKYGVLGLAVGFIMGTYVGKVVSALVGDIIMPIPGALIPEGDWRKAVLSVPIGQGINFRIGDFAGVLIDFLIVSAVVFFLIGYAKRISIK